MRLHEFQIDELKSVPTDVKNFARSPAASTTKEIHHSNNWREAVDAFVEEYDFFPLGSGQFASVYGHTGYPYVIKLFADGDTAFKTWFGWCRKHQHNRFVPKIKGNLIRISDSLLAIRLEKLSPLYGNAFTAYSNFKDIVDTWNLISDPKERPNYAPMNARIEKSYPDFYNDQDIVEIAEYLNSFKFGKSIQLDMHNENIMCRGQDLVITDPLYVVGWNKLI